MYLIFSILILFTISCTPNPRGMGQGFGGPITVRLTMDQDNITDLNIQTHNETPCLMDRAWPVLKERILTANTPLVDNVSGATYTSFGIKTAVAKALIVANKKAPNIALKYDNPNPETTIDDVQTDLVIIGGGPAGLSAALTAYENGVSNIIIVEKLDILSGNGKFDKNFYDMVNSQGQRNRGIMDSADRFYEDMINRHQGDDTNRLRVLADYSATTDAWLRTHKVTLDYVNVDTNGPDDMPRDHQVSEDIYAGDHLQRGLEQSLSNTSIDIRTGTEGLDLVMDGSSVKGVRVKNRDKQNYTIYAKAVLIATGGFSANKDLIAIYNKSYAQLVTSNQEKNLGDFIPLFQKYGMALKNLDIFNIFPYTIVQNRALTGSSELDVDFILINKNGVRFAKERGLSRLQFTDIMLEQPSQMAFYVFDDISRAAGPRIRAHVKKGYALEGKTLDELAQKMSVDVTVFKQSIEDYNKIIKGEVEDPFGRPVYKREFSAKGPYFAIAVRPAVHMTRGGVVVNAKGEVQSTNNTSIRGLYAAGEVTDIQDGAYMAAVALGRATADNITQYLNN
ncbi:MAG: flavocytochrome c [Brevinema sp.]